MRGFDLRGLRSASQLLSGNTVLATLTAAILGLHAAALAWAVLYRRAASLLAVNAAASAAVLAYGLSRLRFILDPPDWGMLGLMGAEVAVLLSAALAARGIRAFVWLSVGTFALHGFISVASVVFALTFRIIRLI